MNEQDIIEKRELALLSHELDVRMKIYKLHVIELIEMVRDLKPLPLEYPLEVYVDDTFRKFVFGCNTMTFNMDKAPRPEISFVYENDMTAEDLIKWVEENEE